MIKEDSYDLRRSKQALEALYPVLEDSHGNVIDGVHRLEADPSWPRRRLEGINTRKQFLVARIVANSQRRRVPREERRKQFDLLATELMDEGLKPGDIASEIESLTGFTRKYVLELVRDEFKRGYGRKSVQPTFEPEEAPSPPEEEGQPRPGLGKPTYHVDRLEGARKHIAEYRARYTQPDEEFLAWEVGRSFGLETGEAKRLVKEGLAPRERPEEEPQAIHEATRRRPAARPVAPKTTRCPLCRRTGADLTLILTRLEEFESQLQPLAYEWVKEALGR